MNNVSLVAIVAMFLAFLWLERNPVASLEKQTYQVSAGGYSTRAKSDSLEIPLK